MQAFAAVLNDMMSTHGINSDALQGRLKAADYTESPAEFQQNLILYMTSGKLPPPSFIDAFAQALELSEEEKKRLVRAHPGM